MDLSQIIICEDFQTLSFSLLDLWVNALLADCPAGNHVGNNQQLLARSV